MTTSTLSTNSTSTPRRINKIRPTPVSFQTVPHWSLVGTTLKFSFFRCMEKKLEKEIQKKVTKKFDFLFLLFFHSTFTFILFSLKVFSFLLINEETKVDDEV